LTQISALSVGGNLFRRIKGVLPIDAKISFATCYPTPPLRLFQNTINLTIAVGMRNVEGGANPELDGSSRRG